MTEHSSIVPHGDYFDDLNYEDTTLVATENINSDDIIKAEALSRLYDRIKQNGMCLEHYKTIETIQPGLLSQINTKKLTRSPSSSQQEIALEFLGKLGLGKFITNGGLATMYANFIEWLTQKLYGMDTATIGKTLEEVWVKMRRVSDNVRKNEFKTQQYISELKRSYMFDDVLKSVIQNLRRENDRRVSDIISALEDVISRNTAVAAVPLTATAKFAFINDATVQDFRSVSVRLTQFPLFKESPLMSTGLAVTRTGLPGALLIKDFIGLNDRTCVALLDIGNSFNDAVRELTRVPTDAYKVDRWLQSVEYKIGRLDAAKNRDRNTGKIINSYFNDSSFSQTLSNYSRSTIGFWYDLKVTPQGEYVINPTTCVDSIKRIFDMQQDRELQRMSDTLHDAYKIMQHVLSELRSVKPSSLDNLIGKYNTNSAKFREIIRQIRRDCVTMLRLMRILEGYCLSHIRAYRLVKPAGQAFLSSAKLYENVKLKM